jgi:hypothetical protein
VVRLRAALSVLEERIRRREPDPNPEGELSAARWWAKHMDNAQPEDHLILTDDRPVPDVAAEVLRVAAWLS